MHGYSYSNATSVTYLHTILYNDSLMMMMMMMMMIIIIIIIIPFVLLHFRHIEQKTFNTSNKKMNPNCS